MWVLGACNRPENGETAVADVLERLAEYERLSQNLLERNQAMSVAADSLIVQTINDNFSPAQQNRILRDTQKMDDYRRWVEASEEALSKHSSATAAMIQEVQAARSRVEPFLARKAPAHEWTPEIEAVIGLLKNHALMAKEADAQFQRWQKDYGAWLENLKIVYPPDTVAAP